MVPRRFGHKCSSLRSLTFFSLPTAAPMLDESVITQLVEMGFPMDACRKAVYYTGNSGAEAAMNWVMSHMDDPGMLKAWNSASH